MLEMDYSDVARDFLRVARVAPVKPGFDYLCRLSRAFGRLPYENLTKILRAAEHADVETRLRTPDIILADHLDLGAGGTCFSLTNFFEQVLCFAGFETSIILCDRSYGAETHCALIVNVDGKRCLVDPGYLLEAPIEIPVRGESVQNGQSCTVRLVRLGESRQLVLFTERGGISKIRYRFKDAPADRERFVERWIDSFDWAMMRHICVSRQTASGQLYVRDGKLRLMKDSSVARDRLDSRFADEVSRLFGIDRSLAELARDAVTKIRSEYTNNG